MVLDIYSHLRLVPLRFPLFYHLTSFTKTLVTLVIFKLRIDFNNLYNLLFLFLLRESNTFHLVPVELGLTGYQ